jgi:hypothetical protein
MIQDLFILLSAMFIFCLLIAIGGLIAKYVFGCDLNEPEYYERKERLRATEKRSKGL